MTSVGRGATGFSDRGDEPLPDTDAKLFQGACWEAARRIRGGVGEFRPAEFRTFHTVTVTGHGTTYGVVCHAHLPLVAFLDAPPQEGKPLSGFMDPPPWADAFEAAGLRPLPAGELDTPTTRLDLSDLTEAEHAQIRYWRPRTLGELLFNWWD